MTFHEVALESFIDMNHELVQLSKAIDWAEVESEFSGTTVRTTAVPVFRSGRWWA